MYSCLENSSSQVHTILTKKIVRFFMNCNPFQLLYKCTSFARFYLFRVPINDLVSIFQNVWFDNKLKVWSSNITHLISVLCLNWKCPTWHLEYENTTVYIIINLSDSQLQKWVWHWTHSIIQGEYCRDKLIRAKSNEYLTLLILLSWITCKMARMKFFFFFLAQMKYNLVLVGQM